MSFRRQTDKSAQMHRKKVTDKEKTVQQTKVNLN